jgi:hypothetical protein
VWPYQRTRARVPTPPQARTVARLDPLTRTRQRSLELNRAERATDPPRSGRMRAAEAMPP